MADSSGVSAPAGQPATPPRATPSELASLFFRLGTTAFGGPAAHIAMMEHEVVRRRRWLTRERFLDLIGAASLIPGPNSTETAIFIGQDQAGWLGLILAGVCFILPAAAITLVVAWAYVRFGSLPQAAGVLYGIKPVIIAVVAQAIWRLGRVALRTRALAILAAAAVILNFLGVDELVVLFGAGAAMAVARRISQTPDARATPAILAQTAAASAGATAAAATPFGLVPLFLFFLKVGAVLFGSGYVLLAFLRTDLVDRMHWLSEAQLLDAVAVGQFTPGPVFTTATFVGYLLGRGPGALVATLGIFLPSFVLVALSGPIIPRLRRSPAAASFLDGVNAGALALMVVVTWHLGAAAIIDAPTALLAVIAAAVLLRFELNSAWLVMAGGLAGIAIRRF
ncbi:MAG TPA: chromate efflux transporter [Candidatus Binataceae bacterium]|nr:chromate efflux transporter [Candidatus Binataceae bacterium]